MSIPYQFSHLMPTAVSWSEPDLLRARVEAASLHQAIGRMDLDLSESGPLDDLAWAGMGKAAEVLTEIFEQGDESDRLLAYALAGFIESRSDLLSTILSPST